MEDKSFMDEIEIPSSLHARTKAGIEKAKAETTLHQRNKKSLKQYMPIAATGIVTAAVLGFVWLSQGLSISEEGNSTTENHVVFQDAGMHPAYIIAITLSILCIGLFYTAIWQKWLKKKWCGLLFLAAMSLNWNYAVYEAHQLLEPEFSPFMNMSISKDSSIIDVSYLLNHGDDKRIEKVIVNGNEKYFVNNNDSYWNPKTNREAIFQNIFSASFTIPYDISTNFLNDLNSTIIAIFNDGSKKTIPLLNTKSAYHNGEIVTNTSRKEIETKLVNSYEETLFLRHDFEAQSIEFPFSFIERVHAKIVMDGETIYNGLVDQTSFVFEKKLAANSKIETIFSPLNSIKYNPIKYESVILYGTDDWIGLNSHIFAPINTINDTKNILWKQRGERNE